MGTKTVYYQVTKEPDKTDYIEEQDFDITGMEITATYSDNSISLITNYIIENGNNLEEGQTSIIISYTEDGVTKKVAQSITVTKNNNGNEDDIVDEQYGYNIKGTKITNIKNKTPISDFINNLIKEEGYEVEITKDGEKVTENYISTGMVVKITNGRGKTVEYIAIVKGDINGDGVSNVRDSLLIKAFRAEIVNPTDAEFEAADIDDDDKITNMDTKRILFHRAEVIGYDLNY